MVIVLPNRDCLVYLWLYYRSDIYMKTIKVYIEGGVCTDVVIPDEFIDKLNYEVIDYDNIETEREAESTSKINIEVKNEIKRNRKKDRHTI